MRHAGYLFLHVNVSWPLDANLAHSTQSASNINTFFHSFRTHTVSLDKTAVFIRSSFIFDATSWALESGNRRQAHIIWKEVGMGWPCCFIRVSMVLFKLQTSELHSMSICIVCLCESRSAGVSVFIQIVSRGQDWLSSLTKLSGSVVTWVIVSCQRCHDWHVVRAGPRKLGCDACSIWRLW